MQHIAITIPEYPHECWIGVGAIRLLEQELSGVSVTVIISDDQVGPLLGAPLVERLKSSGRRVSSWMVPAGEESKSLWQAECLYDFLAGEQIDRQAVIVALGGGVIGDLAGFVASTWSRGIGLIHCPTSLLAAVDSAIGGKNGLNHGHKNAIGTFYQPRAIITDIQFLQTLPDVEFVNGMAECVKHGFLAGIEEWTWLEDNQAAILRRDLQVLEELVYRNVCYKAAIVAQDVTDHSGVRARLNFGHTIGHALEFVLMPALRHGAAVAMGMIGAAFIAQQRGLIEHGLIERLENLLQYFGLPTRCADEIEIDRVLDVLRSDKKNQAGRIRMILPSKWGEVLVDQEVSEVEVGQAINRLLQDGVR
ncbi:MAG: 3-dehydroquinate synthase [Phycisphaerae bacterium]|nr:3-dehydroquinate synthase [Phycisphaerae bacterium]